MFFMIILRAFLRRNNEEYETCIALPGVRNVRGTKRTAVEGIPEVLVWFEQHLREAGKVKLAKKIANFAVSTSPLLFCYSSNDFPFSVESDTARASKSTDFYDSDAEMDSNLDLDGTSSPDPFSCEAFREKIFFDYEYNLLEKEALLKAFQAFEDDVKQPAQDDDDSDNGPEATPPGSFEELMKRLNRRPSPAKFSPTPTKGFWSRNWDRNRRKKKKVQRNIFSESNKSNESADEDRISGQLTTRATSRHR